MTSRTGLAVLRLALLSILVVACAPRQELRLSTALPPDVESEQVFLATDRVLRGPLEGTPSRNDRLSFAALAITVPPNHQPGRVEYWLPEPDPRESFTVARHETLPDLAALQRRLRNAPNADADIVVFVHGFNTNMAEAVYRHAQIAHDYDLRGPQVAFSWPSAAEPLGFVYDRDSIAIARDHLETLLVGLSGSGRRILVVAHSMGAQLTVETLRQMAIGGNTAAMRRLSGVVLLSPDIDIDLFESQLARIDPLPDPFVVVVSRYDRVLRISARLTGRRERLGSVSDIERLKGLGISVIDLSGIAGQSAGNHFVAATSPTAIALLRGLQSTDLRIKEGEPSAVDLAEVMLGIGN